MFIFYKTPFQFLCFDMKQKNNYYFFEKIDLSAIFSSIIQNKSEINVGVIGVSYNFNVYNKINKTCRLF